MRVVYSVPQALPPMPWRSGRNFADASYIGSVLTALLLLAACCVPVHGSPRCLPDDPAVRRTIEVDGRTVPLSVELNQRDSHELSTHILRILLEEVMGYNVTLARFSADPFTLARLSGCSVAQGLSECCVGPNCAPENLPQLTVPEVMVDVEVWPWQLDQRSSMWLRYGNNILSAGTLGSVGWSGFFVSEHTSERLWQSRLIAEHWRSYLLPAVVAAFEPATSNETINRLAERECERQIMQGEPYAQTAHQLCERGWFHPPQCSPARGGAATRCGTLLAMRPDFHSVRVAELITQTGINMSVAFLGRSHFGDVVRERIRARQPVIFHHWHPSAFIAGLEVLPVALPAHSTSCLGEDGGNRSNLHCEFTSAPLQKFTWMPLRQVARPAFDLVRRMSLSADEMEEMMARHVDANGDKDSVQLACDWVQRRRLVWGTWITPPPACDSSHFTYHVDGCERGFRAVTFRWHTPDPADPTDSLDCVGGTRLPRSTRVACEYVDFDDPLALVALAPLLLIVLCMACAAHLARLRKRLLHPPPGVHEVDARALRDARIPAMSLLAATAVSLLSVALIGAPHDALCAINSTLLFLACLAAAISALWLLYAMQRVDAKWLRRRLPRQAMRAADSSSRSRRFMRRFRRSSAGVAVGSGLALAGRAGDAGTAEEMEALWKAGEAEAAEEAEAAAGKEAPADAAVRTAPADAAGCAAPGHVVVDVDANARAAAEVDAGGSALRRGREALWRLLGRARQGAELELPACPLRAPTAGAAPGDAAAGAAAARAAAARAAGTAPGWKPSQPTLPAPGASGGQRVHARMSTPLWLPANRSSSSPAIIEAPRNRPTSHRLVAPHTSELPRAGAQPAGARGAGSAEPATAAAAAQSGAVGAAGAAQVSESSSDATHARGALAQSSTASSDSGELARHVFGVQATKQDARLARDVADFEFVRSRGMRQLLVVFLPVMALAALVLFIVSPSTVAYDTVRHTFGPVQTLQCSPGTLLLPRYVLHFFLLLAACAMFVHIVRARWSAHARRYMWPAAAVAFNLIFILVTGTQPPANVALFVLRCGMLSLSAMALLVLLLLPFLPACCRRGARRASGKQAAEGQGLQDLLPSVHVRPEELEMGSTIGEGGFGEVTLAHYYKTPVAVKRIRHAVTQLALQTFAAEAAVMATMRHPNVVLLMGYCADPPLIMMEYLPNDSVFHMLHVRRAALHRTLRMRMLQDAARGMNFLHSRSRPIVHGDLKSPNLLLDENWRCKVSDFGLSLLRESAQRGGGGGGGGGGGATLQRTLSADSFDGSMASSDMLAMDGHASGALTASRYTVPPPHDAHARVNSAPSAATLTARAADTGGVAPAVDGAAQAGASPQPRSLVGSVLWAAPEVLRSEALTEKSDVFAFGVVLFEMLFSEVPFSDMPAMAVPLQVLAGRRALDHMCAQLEDVVEAAAAPAAPAAAVASELPRLLPDEFGDMSDDDEAEAVVVDVLPASPRAAAAGTTAAASAAPTVPAIVAGSATTTAAAIAAGTSGATEARSATVPCAMDAAETAPRPPALRVSMSDAAVAAAAAAPASARNVRSPRRGNAALRVPGAKQSKAKLCLRMQRRDGAPVHLHDLRRRTDMLDGPLAALLLLMERCWHHEPQYRPSFHRVLVCIESVARRYFQSDAWDMQIVYPAGAAPHDGDEVLPSPAVEGGAAGELAAGELAAGELAAGEGAVAAPAVSAAPAVPSAPAATPQAGTTGAAGEAAGAGAGTADTDGSSLAFSSLASMPCAAVGLAPPAATGAAAGTRLDRKFEVNPEDLQLGPEIGRGTYGRVLEARYVGTHVAVKQLYAKGLPAKVLQEFYRECSLMRHLRHPNLVLFIGYVRRPPCLLLITELMERGSLYAIYHEEPRDADIGLHLTKVVGAATDVARGMAYLHSRSPPILHRDLKSPNVMVDDKWTAKVGDFGLSRVKDTARTMTKVGSPLWVAPEVLRGERFGEGCDVYSFGVIMSELLCWAEPYPHLATVDVMNGVAHAGLRPSLPAFTPPDVQLMVHACWKDDQRERPAFAQVLTFLEALHIHLQRAAHSAHLPPAAPHLYPPRGPPLPLAPGPVPPGMPYPPAAHAYPYGIAPGFPPVPPVSATAAADPLTAARTPRPPSLPAQPGTPAQ